MIPDFNLKFWPTCCEQKVDAVTWFGSLILEFCCTTGFKIELPNARASVCLIVVHFIYQPARTRYSLQAELPLVI
jgi:hypothetical protein